MEPPEVLSAIPGLRWPGLPGGIGNTRLALLYQLEQSQWWPEATLLDHQFRQLAELLRHAVRTVPFYRGRHREWGIDLDAPLSREVWSRIPVLERREAQAAQAELVSEEPPASHGRVVETLTSGSTGTPLKVAKTGISGLFWEVFTLRDHLLQRRNLSGKLAAIRPVKQGVGRYPEGFQADDWGSPTGATFATGKGALLDITSKIHEQAEWLQRQDPDYLLTYPSNLRALAHACRDRNLKLPRLRQVQTVAELLYPEVRALCREVFGVPVADIYGCAEAGYIALQCPEGDGLHVQAEGVLVEVLDDGGEPRRPGEVGQVVITPLHNFAMPLIRYQLGDLAEVGPPCRCGRGLPVVTRVLGRQRSMVVLPDGQRHFANFQDLLAGFDAVIQFQIVRRAAERLEMKLVARRALTPEEATALAARVRERFQYPFVVDLEYCEEIPRSPSGKFADYEDTLFEPN